MKKLFATVFMAVSVSISLFAQDANQTYSKAVTSFDDTFTGASNVVWSFGEDFTKATFFQDNHRVEVFYNAAGDFVATTTQIKLEDAPAYVKKAVEKKYSNYSVNEAFVFKADDQTKYFISLEDERENIVLAGNNGAVIVYSRTLHLTPEK
ncbi:MAG: hypothetical protein INR73_17670 [Williamsia sp.]|nr:hypothetical protein [Williamsia sp.]